MKNLLIFNSPNRSLPAEYVELTKIQIDNSLSLGWKSSDIIFAANFDFEYKGVKTIVVGDYYVYDQNRSTKVQVINELFSRDYIKDKELYWFHDFDAFQLVPFDLDLEKDLSQTDAAFTTHGAFDPKLWNAGSFFFKNSARDIFLWIEEYMNKLNSNEQGALTHMWENNINNINDKYILLDPSYNLGIYKIPENIKNSKLPIKVAHFHPHKKRHLDLYRDILPERLMKIFNEYGIK